MTLESLPLWLALATQLGLGLAVFRANYNSKANQSFLLVSIFISAWLLSLQFAFNAATGNEAGFWIRNALASGILIINGFNFLRIGITNRDASWPRILIHSAGLFAPSLFFIALCFTPFVLIGAAIPQHVPGHEMIPTAVYGPLGSLYNIFLVGAAIVVTLLYLRAARRSSGAQRNELQFVVIGVVVLIVLAIAGAVLLPFLPRAARVRLAPFRVVIFSLVIAYGIATRKMMDVGAFLRQLTGYVLLGSYLAGLYALVWWLASGVFSTHRGWSDNIAHILAATVLVLSMAPAQGVFQHLATKLFARRTLDFRTTVSKAASILSSVTTLDDLLARFAATIGEAVQTDRVLLLLSERQDFIQRYPPIDTDGAAPPLFLERKGRLIGYLQKHREPVVRDELSRTRLTADSEGVLARMFELNIAVMMGIFARDHLSGVMLLGPRFAGRIYGAAEQNALQVLCGQLAVAIENAQLFTEVQNAKIYTETLLANLTTGVIAAGSDELITVFNKEAGQITGLDPATMIDRPLAELPTDLCALLRETLSTGEGQEHREIPLRDGDRFTAVRASSSIFRDEHGGMLGALTVFTDITALKRLELQIRRSDRLASLGTLSAGMAHEIKNPLVSIKTFAQLLPERYNESDFRETFSNLIGHEIDRIDSLVNQLLRFARPAKPVLQPMHAHDVLEKTLQLVSHRLYQSEIKLSRFWRADADTIRADADQLEQVFLNFFLNAMDAMKHGGDLSVTTEIERNAAWLSGVPGTNGDGEVHEVLRITIRDTGEGIRSEDIPHVFDPFFTTKDYGTGLGLSVVHGIVQEHGGQIEVESEIAQGTAFHILLPLVRFADSKVAA